MVASFGLTSGQSMSQAVRTITNKVVGTPLDK
ncbi:hypothetical protein EDF46_0325 [Frondihabitans sp. PhB188]|nr:hypothetical protein EDF46_0325 [Frondihabitans sp. PhB188]